MSVLEIILYSLIGTASVIFIGFQVGTIIKSRKNKKNGEKEDEEQDEDK